MTERVKQKVLIVDDHLENIKIIIELLKSDYKTFFAQNGEKALEIAQKKQPDIILLDIVMPGMDGYEVCQQLMAERATRDIPVIFISAKNEVGDETKGFEIGAMDYITKPISPAIVKARIKNHLKLHKAMQELQRLYNMALDSNPLTGLPGNNSITLRIKKALGENEDVAVIYSDLDNFKAFNDAYGFALGDDVLLFTCQVFQEVLSTLEAENSFIGHVGGDDFVMVVPSESIQETADAVIQRFDEGIISFYSEHDQENQCIESVNRQGERQTFPLMTISLAGVDLSHRRYDNYLEVNDACAYTKKIAKALEGSSFFLERRKAKE